MNKEIEYFLKEFIAALQVARIYTVKHPKFYSSVDTVLEILQDLLAAHDNLVIGIVGEELAFEKDIFQTGFYKNKAVLLHACIKKTQKTPVKELNKARAAKDSLQ